MRGPDLRGARQCEGCGEPYTGQGDWVPCELCCLVCPRCWDAGLHPGAILMELPGFPVQAGWRPRGWPFRRGVRAARGGERVDAHVRRPAVK